MVDAENLVHSFHRSAQETATKALQAPFATISAVAFDYFQSVQGFCQELLASGLAADPGILGTGIMRPDITPEQIMAMPLFADALRKRNAAKEEHRRSLQAEKMQADAAGAGKERDQARRQRALYTHPGLPSSAEEASRMLGRPLPPTYVEVAYRPFQERDVRPKTRASRRKAGGRVKAERSTSS